MNLLNTLFGGSETSAYGPQADYLNQLYGAGRGLLSQAPQYSQAGVTGAEQALQNVIGGQYLPGGQYGNLFNENLQAQFRQAMPQVTSAFARGGRGGSGLSTQALGQTFGDIYSGLYSQERQNQMNALNMAPSIYGFRQQQALQPYQLATQIGSLSPQMMQESTSGLLPGIANTIAGVYGLSNLFGRSPTPSLRPGYGAYTPYRGPYG